MRNLWKDSFFRVYNEHQGNTPGSSSVWENDIDKILGGCQKSLRLFNSTARNIQQEEAMWKKKKTNTHGRGWKANVIYQGALKSSFQPHGEKKSVPDSSMLDKRDIFSFCANMVYAIWLWVSSITKNKTSQGSSYSPPIVTSTIKMVP